MNIHPTAVIGGKAELGAGVKVGPMAFIEDGARIGDNTEIGPGAVVLRHVTLGCDCRVHAHAVLGDWPQDLAFENRDSYVKIGDRCIIREGVTIHRGTKPGTDTVVGAGCFFMVNSHVGHNCVLGDHVIMANGALLGGYVEMGSGVFVSGNCLVHQFVRVGRLAMLSGGSAISKDLPPFCTSYGLRGNQVAGLNVVGMRRAGLKPDERLMVKRAFHKLYLEGLNIPDAAAAIQGEFQAGPGREMADFVVASKRGICRLAGGRAGSEVS